MFRFCVVFSRKIVQISIFKVEYLENGLADFNDFCLILQDFERSFRWNQIVLGSQFSFNRVYLIENFKNKTKLPCIQTLAGVTVVVFLSETIILISYVDQRTSKIEVCVVSGSSGKPQEQLN